MGTYEDQQDLHRTDDPTVHGRGREKKRHTEKEMERQDIKMDRLRVG